MLDLPIEWVERGAETVLDLTLLRWTDELSFPTVLDLIFESDDR